LKIIQELNKVYDPFEFLRNYGITVRHYKDRIVLNYDQIESHSHRFVDFVKECRGLILSWPDYNILCRSFDRFFNYKEDPKSRKFHIENSIIMEKIDGSMVNVYHDGNSWQAATRSMAFAEGETKLPDYTFRDLFNTAIGIKDINEAFKEFDKHYTYILELVSPITRVVKPYPTTNLYALAMREKYTGQWMKTINAIKYITLRNPLILKPKIYSFDSEEAIMESFTSMDAFDEGYVCLIEYEDGSVWRVKVKNPSYLAIAHLRENGGLSEKSICKLVYTNDYDEYLTMFPEDKEFFNPYITAFNKMLKELNFLYDKHKDITNQKDFALKIKHSPCCGILFNLRKGRTLKEIFERMSVSSKVDLLRKYKKEK